MAGWCRPPSSSNRSDLERPKVAPTKEKLSTSFASIPSRMLAKTRAVASLERQGKSRFLEYMPQLGQVSERKPGSPFYQRQRDSWPPRLLASHRCGGWWCARTNRPGKRCAGGCTDAQGGCTPSWGAVLNDTHCPPETSACVF
jgi:hypothetical protein